MTSFVRSFFNGNKKEESIYQIKEEHYEDLGLIEENILKNDNKKIKSCRKQISHGAFNIVYNCDEIEGNILRKTVDPIFEKINGSYEIAYETKRDIINMWQENLSKNLKIRGKIRKPNKEDEESIINNFLIEQKLTISNLNISSKLKISPEVKFNGYVEEDKDGRTLLYHAVKMEKYDINLYEYTKENSKYNETQKIIVEKLVDLFQKMHKEMNIVCYDLKLENIVLKLKDSNIEDIKLIDWDGNYCNNHNIDEIKDTKLLLFMSIIIIANNFIHRIENGTNIFYDYYLKNEKEINEKEDELIKLFCNKKYLYSYMVKFYFLKNFLKQERKSFMEKYDDIINFFKYNMNDTIENICLFKTLLIGLKSKDILNFKYSTLNNYKNKGIKNDDKIILNKSIKIDNKRITKRIFYTTNKFEIITSTINELYKVKKIDFNDNVELFELSYLPNVSGLKLNMKKNKYNEFIKKLPRLYAFISKDNKYNKIIDQIEEELAEKIDKKKSIIKKENNILIVEYSIYLEEFFYAKEIHKNYDELQNEIKKNNEIFKKQEEERKKQRKEYYDTFNSGPLGPVELGDTDLFGYPLRGGKKTKKRSKKKNMRKTRRK